MLVTDLHHSLDLPEDTPGPARRLAEHLNNIVRAATAGDAGTPWMTTLPCRRRPARRSCPGRMIVLRSESSALIQWQCSACQDAGVISNWQDSPYDLRRRRLALARPVTEVVLSEEVAAALRELQLLDLDCECLVFAMRSDDARVILRATEDDLDELIGFVAAEANHETNRRRQQRLDTALEALTDAAQTLHSRSSTDDSLFCSTPAGTLTAMALPELDVARVQRWCAARVPEHARHQVRVECQVAPRHLTIVERRAPWRADFGPEWTSFPIARLRYTPANKTWTLYWRDRNRRFHLYDRLAPSPTIDDVLLEIDSDPTCIFWG
jgi:plasmid stabilization system protein ParE